jgi:hypothetical protein
MKYPVFQQSRLFVIMAAIAVCATLIFVACQKGENPTIISDTAALQLSESDEKLINDLEIIGKLHNEGLKSVFNQFTDKLDKNQLASLPTTPNSINRARIRDFVANFVSNQYSAPLDKVKDAMDDMDKMDKKQMSPIVKSYVSKLHSTLQNSKSVEQGMANLNEMLRTNVGKISDINEKIAFIAMVQTAKYSMMFWTENQPKWDMVFHGKTRRLSMVSSDAIATACNPCRPTTTWDYVEADAEGACWGGLAGCIRGAITGLVGGAVVGGPAGGAGGALTGGILNGLAGAVAGGVVGSAILAARDPHCP